MLQAWQPNTLPLPCSAARAAIPGDVQAAEAGSVSVPVQPKAPLPPLPPMVEVDDNFPKGRILKYFPYQGHGTITDRKGREVYFDIAELDMVGPKGRDDIKAGLPVGYDVSCTSSGLRVKKLKVY